MKQGDRRSVRRDTSGRRWQLAAGGREAAVAVAEDGGGRRKRLRWIRLNSVGN